MADPIKIIIPAIDDGRFLKVSALNPIFTDQMHSVLGYSDPDEEMSFEVHAEQTLVISVLNGEEAKQRDMDLEAEIARMNPDALDGA